MRRLIAIGMLGFAGACARSTEPVAPVAEVKIEEAPETSAEDPDPAPLPSRASTLSDQDEGADRIGIEACDEFLQKYERCVVDSPDIPDAVVPSYRESIDQMREAWRDMARNPSGKKNLEAGCKRILESAKDSMTELGCDW